MLRTYKAVLRGDRVEWVDGAPTPTQQPTPVHITLLEDDSTGDAPRGREMAAALEALARSGGLTAIADPVAWQREERRNRDLDRRDE